MNDYKSFKSLLEYFVSHLEWVVNQDPNHPGYKTYIEPIRHFKKAGQGWKGHNIQKQIRNWEQYPPSKVNINVYASDYQSRGCYLNWHGTWKNVRPGWRDNHIEYLYLSQEEYAWAKKELSAGVFALGLFDGEEPNAVLQNFYDEFVYLYNEVSPTMKNCINLLRTNHNLVLTGAPGTGKTFLAQKIAEAMGASIEDGSLVMVQFHPSYDYTDFVEGLRPIKNEETGQIEFQLQPGVFKKFCQAAQENIIDSKKSLSELSHEEMIETAYESLINDIENGDRKVLSLRTGEMDIVDVSEKNNIHLKTQDSLSDRKYTVSLARLKKLALAYKTLDDLEQIDNIYKCVTEAIKGCHASSYWALLRLLYKEYMPNIEKPTNVAVKRKDYVFIIDEINRGDLSKIFGELFFSIDPGYRGEKGRVSTQYQNLVEEGDVFGKGFYVPENVYILATMNDIDRSIESMDFAIRRRFCWYEVTAKGRQDMLEAPDSWPKDKMPDKETLEKIKHRMDMLNDAIASGYNTDGDEEPIAVGLGREYQIGASYFLKLANYDFDFEQLWQLHLKGLIHEYLRGEDNAAEKLAILKAAYDDEFGA